MDLNKVRQRRRELELQCIAEAFRISVSPEPVASYGPRLKRMARAVRRMNNLLADRPAFS